jgi:hypothetical protein
MTSGTAIRRALPAWLACALLHGAPAAAVDLAVDVSAERRPIDPHVYGLHYASDAAFAAEVRLPVRRWGGNDSSLYNWTINAFNNGLDYYFENNARGSPSADEYVARDQGMGADTIVTMPLTGYVAKDTTSCGFSVSKYGYAPYDAAPDRPDCGDGVRDDGFPVTGVDPLDVGAPAGADFVRGWVEHLVDGFGPAAAGGVRFYSLDNEPGLWHETHRDVHPDPIRYDEIRDRGIETAGAIKDVDPGAQVLGPVQDGWTRYFFASYVDYAQATGDRDAHGGVDFLPWYLDQFRQADALAGRRTLDYLDVHYYPQAPGVTLSGAGDGATQALRLRAVKSLYDPTYVDESWIAQAGPDGGVIRLIPRLRAWIDANYPGTKLAITEYDFGGHESLNGALAEADVLGVFGREGVDLATLFDTPYSGGAFTPGGPGAFAFRIYRNYDGQGSGFGETHVAAVSSDPDSVSIYAAERAADGAVTIVLINKTTGDLPASVALAGWTPGPSARVFHYDASDLGSIQPAPDLAVDAGRIATSLPASSITLLVVPEPRASAAAGAVALGLLAARLRRPRAASRLRATAPLDRPAAV